MDSAWVGVVGALGGVIVGAAGETLRARYAFQREKRWAVQDQQRQRLEAVYETLETLRRSYDEGVVDTAYAVQFGKPRPRPDQVPKAPWSHLRMLVNLYTPWLKVRLESVDAAARKVGSAMADAIQAQRGHLRYDQPFIDAMYAASKSLAAAIDAMNAEVVASVRRLDQEVLATVGSTQAKIVTGE